jgi:hypothetical protein
MLLDEFQGMQLSNDGIHLTSGSTTSYLQYLLEAAPEGFANPADTNVSRDERLATLMVCFQTKNPNLGKFWRALEWKMLLYFMTIWNILWPFGIIYGPLV